MSTSQYIQLALCPLPRHPLFIPQVPHLLQLRLQIPHGLIHQKLLKGPFLNVSRFVFFKMVDVLHRTAENSALGLLARAIGYYPTELIDSLVNVATTPTLNLFLQGDIKNRP